MKCRDRMKRDEEICVCIVYMNDLDVKLEFSHFFVAFVFQASFCCARFGHVGSLAEAATAR